MLLGAAKVICYALLFTSGLSQLLQFETWWFAQNVNLIFHEAGHVLFYVFGEFMFVLGGTIMELLVPSIITLMFIAQKDWFAASCTSWWCMTAWLSVSIYASDAQSRLIPLISGDRLDHDWFWLLREVNLLHADYVIGWVFWGVALFMLVAGAALLTQDKHVKFFLAPYRRGS